MVHFVSKAKLLKICGLYANFSKEHRYQLHCAHYTQLRVQNGINFKGTRFITKKQFCRAFNENDCQIGSLIPSQFISIRVLNNPEI